jgi:malonyl-CoA O-methyltransferase
MVETPRARTRTADPAPATDLFSERVRDCFSGAANQYEGGARIQRAIAWRLGHLCRPLAIGPGPKADLGAGTGLLARSIVLHRPDLNLLRLDNCQALLEQEPPQAGASSRLLWDLNLGLPAQLAGASLLASSFALQWLEQPRLQLDQWASQLARGGWLVLAVPCSASFEQWRQAAGRARVPFTGLALPAASELIEAVECQLQVVRCQRLRFSRRRPQALAFLRELKAIGAQASPTGQLSRTELRRLQTHWTPNPPKCPLEWEVLLLLARKP